MTQDSMLSSSVSVETLPVQTRSDISEITQFSVSTNDDSRDSRDDDSQEDPDQYPDGGTKAYLVLVGSFLGLISNLGLINATGAVQTYVSANQLLGVKTSTVSWIFSIYFSLAYGVGLFIGPVFDRHGPTALLAAATVLISGGFMACANSSTVWQFILSLSICVGIGNGIATTPLVGVVNHWFFTKRGNATGFATSGGSIGGLLIPLMLRLLYTKVGYAWAMRILSFFCLFCMGCSILLVRSRIQKIPENTNSSGSRKAKLLSPIVGTFKSLDFKALREPKFAFLVGGAFAAELSLLLVVTYFATYAIAQGMSESDSYLLLVLWNATGILGRWIPGYASDYLGRFNINLLMLLGYTLLILVLWLPFGASRQVLFLFAAIGGFFLGLVLLMVPLCLAQISPVRDFGGRYGIVLFFLSIGNLIGVPIGAAIIGDSSKHNYDMFVMLVGILAAVGFALWVTSRFYLVGIRLNVKV